MKERTLIVYPNAVTMKGRNARFTVADCSDNDDSILEFRIVGPKDVVDVPRANHIVLRNTATVTQIRVQKDRIQDMIDVLLEYQQRIKLKEIKEKWVKGTDITFTYTKLD